MDTKDLFCVFFFLTQSSNQTAQKNYFYLPFFPTWTTLFDFEPLPGQGEPAFTLSAEANNYTWYSI